MTPQLEFVLSLAGIIVVAGVTMKVCGLDAFDMSIAWFIKLYLKSKTPEPTSPPASPKRARWWQRR